MTFASIAAQSPAVPAVVLTIAGSESTGGAGAQADLKTFQELGVFGIANLTCIVSFDPNNSWTHRFALVKFLRQVSLLLLLGRQGFLSGGSVSGVGG